MQAGNIPSRYRRRNRFNGNGNGNGGNSSSSGGNNSNHNNNNNNNNSSSSSSSGGSRLPRGVHELVGILRDGVDGAIRLPENDRFVIELGFATKVFGNAVRDHYVRNYCGRQVRVDVNLRVTAPGRPPYQGYLRVDPDGIRLVCQVIWLMPEQPTRDAAMPAVTAAGEPAAMPAATAAQPVVRGRGHGGGGGATQPVVRGRGHGGGGATQQQPAAVVATSANDVMDHYVLDLGAFRKRSRTI